MIGQTIRHYRIETKLGAGGMGEVYKATDTRLDRPVAIKVLPPQIAANTEARQRLEREARAVSSLNHPHICVLHDLGSEGGVDFLVMEYLEGETLAARVARGPLPLDQALRYAVQVAGALGQAHKQGIYHRDLKPGNIMITRTGAKLLDFGLAKMQSAALDATISAGLTQKGAILGTLQYMAPEQIEGKPVDGRTDIFAFGAVLYEMLTGQRAFAGSTHTSLVAGILTGTTPSVAHPAVDRVVRKCLAKDPEDRWQSAQDLQSELQWIAEGGQAAQTDAPAAPRRRVLPLGWIAAAVLFVVALPFVVAYFRRPGPDAAAARPVRFTIEAPEKSTFTSPPVVSPDGSRLALPLLKDGRREIWMRPLDSVAAQPLAGAEDGEFPFWSPDGRFVGFFAHGKLKKIAIGGGPAQNVAEARRGRGGAWGRDGTLVFAPDVSSPLYQVPATGGNPAPVTKLDAGREENSHRWPSFLPDGRHFLYYARSRQSGKNGVLLGSLDGQPGRPLLSPNSSAIFVSGAEANRGYVLYVNEGTLLAHPWDNGKLAFTGEPVPLAQGVAGAQPASQSGFDTSRAVLVYGGGLSSMQQMTWFDRTGKRLGTLGHPGIFMRPEFSPDGARVAVDILNSQTGAFDVWVLELARGTTSRLTFGYVLNWHPLWTPDGSRVIYTTSGGKGAGDLYQKLASGAGEQEPLSVLESARARFAMDFSDDGQYLLYEEESGRGEADLWLLPMTGDRRPRTLPNTPFAEKMGQFSPGRPPRWFAYVSNETGRNEVYVQTFPPSGAKWQISAQGGSEPRWRADGKELFYRAGDGKLMAVPVKPGASFETGTPQALFGPCGSTAGPRETTRYAVTAGGDRFIVLCVVDDAAAAAATVVLNWQAALVRPQ
jgi:Tol biopolymer transport system component